MGAGQVDPWRGLCLVGVAYCDRARVRVRVHRARDHGRGVNRTHAASPTCQCSVPPRPGVYFYASPYLFPHPISLHLLIHLLMIHRLNQRCYTFPSYLYLCPTLLKPRIPAKLNTLIHHKPASLFTRNLDKPFFFESTRGSVASALASLARASTSMITS